MLLVFKTKPTFLRTAGRQIKLILPLGWVRGDIALLALNFCCDIKAEKKNKAQP